MNITMIGTGRMAAAMGAVISKLPHNFTIASRNIEQAQQLADNLGQGVKANTLENAVVGADVLILATPYTAISEVFSKLGDVRDQVLIDITNPITPDFKGLLVGHHTSAAEEIQQLVPHAYVVKAFNTIFSGLFEEAYKQPNKVQTLLAGNHTEAVEKVTLLATQMGFQPLNAGELSNSRFIEPIGEMNIHFGYFLGMGTKIAPAWQVL